MLTLKAQSMGGKATAIISRAAALERYYQSPNLCKYCNSIIKVQEGQKVSEVRKKVFCNHTCSASYTNRRRELKPKYTCPSCGKKINKNNKSCRSCKASSKLPSTTKADLIQSRKGYQSYRSSVQHHAKIVYKQSGRPFICVVCGYDKHVDICHINAVANFPDKATIEEINSIDNLTTLCPNCHWEFDNKLLDLVTGFGVEPN